MVKKKEIKQKANEFIQERIVQTGRPFDEAELPEVFDMIIQEAKKEVFDDLLKRQKRELIIGVAYRDVILLNHKEFEELKQRHLSTFSEKEKAT